MSLVNAVRKKKGGLLSNAAGVGGDFFKDEPPWTYRSIAQVIQVLCLPSLSIKSVCICVLKQPLRMVLVFELPGDLIRQ